MLRAGDVVGDTWRIVARLGEGGMGTVWRALDVRSGAEVALKTISAGGAWDPEIVGRFEREAILAARVDAGGGVARVHALRRVEQGVVMVQELVEGTDLGRLARERGVDRARLVRLVAAVARTLARIHGEGVVHRDVKPSNIVVRAADDAPVLVDFGLAWSTGVSRLTVSGAVIGTPSYMAPEQVTGASQAHEPSVDVHGLGAVLYECLTGRPPRLGGGLGGLAALASGVPPPAPRSLDPTIDAALEALVMQALSFDPARRPAALALAEALERWSLAPVVARSRRGRVAALTLGVAVGVIGASALAHRTSSRETLAEHALAIEPPERDGTAEVTSTWRALLREWVGEPRTLAQLRAGAAAIGSQAHTEALDETADLWAERLSDAYPRDEAPEVLRELAGALALVHGATLGPRLTAVLDQTCADPPEQAEALKRQRYFDPSLREARGRRLVRYAGALRALPGGRAGPALQEALADLINTSMPVKSVQAEALLAAVHAGTMLNAFGDAYFVGKFARVEDVRATLEVHAGRGDGAAHFLLACALLPDSYLQVPLEPAAVLRHLKLARARLDDLSPRHRAEAQVLEACTRAKQLAPQDALGVTELLRAACDAAAPWALTRHPAVHELARLPGREAERLALWLEQREHLEAAPVGPARDVLIGQVLARLVALQDHAGDATAADQLQREVEAHLSVEVRAGFIAAAARSRDLRERPRAVVETAPTDAWRSEPFLEGVADLASTVDPATARTWLQRALAAQDPLAEDRRRAEALRRLSDAARR